MTRETPFMRRLIVALSAVPGIQVHRQNAGRLVIVDPKTGKRRAFQAAPPGAADISGIAAPDGRRLEVETKAEKGKPREAQDRWAAMIERHGGVYVRVSYDESVTMADNLAKAVIIVTSALTSQRTPAKTPADEFDDDQTEF